MRAQVRPRSSHVPSPMEGIFAPLASTYCMNPLTDARIMSLRSALGEGGKHHLGRMRDDGEQRAGWTARRSLALFPVPDGLDGNAEPRGELLLRQPRAATEVAHFDRPGVVRHHGGLQRELPTVPQFDNPTVRLQP